MANVSNKLYNFTGRVALITGSSSGIGAAIARQLARHGASVVITGREKENLNAIATEIGNDNQAVSSPPPSILQVIGDLSDRSFVPHLMAQTIDRYGRLDILVNNAGMAASVHTLEQEHLLANFDQLMELNVRSVLQLTQLAAPHLIRTKGNVINISSVASLIPWSLLYSISKAALDMLTKTTAGQLATSGVRVNSVNPGPVVTRIGRSWGNEEKFNRIQAKQHVHLTALKRIAQPDDIANLVTFLASDQAANITGSIVVNDGGATVNSVA